MRFGSVYTNCGFIGFPLVQSLIGDIGVFYAVPFNITYNIFVWSHGVNLFRRGEGISKSAAARRSDQSEHHPVTAIGLLLFLTQVSLPAIPSRCSRAYQQHEYASEYARDRRQPG